MKVTLPLLILTLISACSTVKEMKLPAQQGVVNPNSYDLKVNTAPITNHSNSENTWIIGGGFSYITAITLNAEGQVFLFPKKSVVDLGDPYLAKAKLYYSDQGYLLELPGGDGAESYTAWFVLNERHVIWRRLGWTGPDNKGRHLKAYYKDLIIQTEQVVAPDGE